MTSVPPLSAPSPRGSGTDATHGGPGAPRESRHGGGERHPWEHCVTCSDEGVPMRVESVDDEAALAVCVDEDGARLEVQTALIEDVGAGDLLLVHAGTALLRLDGGAAS